ncbi:MAG: RraA family protein [Candidatus Thioglobus sp.]|jgi:regulator of RNase E activity RraA|nr:RraA family protein [Candidatus Thioglobus sp.]|tara:strand:+ start:3026 stop:3736 length:711 start_codon:yes stop_codon:yes gene_type:complete
MANELIDAELLSLLRSVDTPTVCNAIEVAQGQRGFNQFTRGTMICSSTKSAPMVGFAKTAKIAALSPSTESQEIIKKRRMEYYRYMSDFNGPAVAVIEDIDYPECIGAYWGEINTKVHKGFGLTGALTNGVVRDLGDLAEDFPVVAGSIGPSHGFVHVSEIDSEVNIFGLRVSPGDLMHADLHGAVVIPVNVISNLKEAINKLLDSEKLILEPAGKKDFNFDSFKKAWEAFEKSRT